MSEKWVWFFNKSGHGWTKAQKNPPSQILDPPLQLSSTVHKHQRMGIILSAKIIHLSHQEDIQSCKSWLTSLNIIKNRLCHNTKHVYLLCWRGSYAVYPLRESLAKAEWRLNFPAEVKAHNLQLDVICLASTTIIFARSPPFTMVTANLWFSQTNQYSFM